MKWKKMALELYFHVHGRRCVLCSKPVTTPEAHIEIREKEYHLMHKLCATREKV
jgi:hypothetical protein